jgi:hypothetical protein
MIRFALMFMLGCFIAYVLVCIVRVQRADGDSHIHH